MGKSLFGVFVTFFFFFSRWLEIRKTKVRARSIVYYICGCNGLIRKHVDCGGDCGQKRVKFDDFFYNTGKC